jgi:homoserine kinase
VTATNLPGEVTVSVPATSANLGPGFDALGLALELRDLVRARREPAGVVTVHVSGEGESTVPRDESHLVVRAAHATWDAMGEPRSGLTLWCTNVVPHGRGLGSSAAAAVAGVLAARALAGAPDDPAAALAVATALEGHPDNAAAALLGGLTIAWTPDDPPSTPRAVRIEPSPDLRAIVLVPDVELSTETARGLLPATVPHVDAAYTAGRAALLVEAVSRRPDLLLEATEDRLHQTYRAPAMPATAELVALLRARGWAAVVSGAGPTVLVLSARDRQPGPESLRGPAGPGWRVLDPGLAPVGAIVDTVG